MTENQATTATTTATITDFEEGRKTCAVRHSDGTMCEAPIYAKRTQLCSKHYVAAKSNDPAKLDAKAKTGQTIECKVDNCDRPVYAKRSGLCSKHYVAARKLAAGEAAEEQADHDAA